MTNPDLHSNIYTFTNLNAGTNLCRNELISESIDSLKASDSSLSRTLNSLHTASMPNQQVGQDSLDRNLNLNSQFISEGSLLPDTFCDSAKNRSSGSFDTKSRLPHNTLTLDRVDSTLMDETQTYSNTTYNFDSIPLFSQEHISPFSSSHIVSTKGSKENVNTYTQHLFANSIIWIPKSREEWDACSAELTGLCASASRRRSRKMKRNCPAVLPEIYIRDRIDIDDPLRGFQIRHKVGGWLQGFILTTTFTTWTRFFRWDSRHPKSGMIPTPSSSQKTKWDDGILSSELESQPRSGDPIGGGVIWSTIAEISLLGGLGCGKYLLRMALDDISRQGCYKYVVLQATEFSRPFYEKFGFKRVGCVTRYGTHPHLVGYRHWTYADEKNLVVHGGPSYMMAIRLKDSNRKSTCDDSKSILEDIDQFIVKDKPKILPLAIDPQSQLNQSNSRKRKRDAVKKVPNDKELIRVVSYCRESEKENCLKISESNTANDTMMNQSKTNKTNLDRVLSEMNQTTRCISTANNFETPKGKRKPPRVRYQNGIGNSSSKSHLNNSKGSNSPTVLDPFILRKQKFTISQRVRNKPIFYNKVVAKKNMQRTRDSFYFVIHFDADRGTLRLVRLEQRGRFFKGKREGCVKWKAILDERKGILSEDKTYDWTVSASEWEVVQSVMVTKTTIVADESWDIIESNIPMQ